jgi:hypothetical protein
VCVDLAIHTVTAINAPLMGVPLAQIALWDSFQIAIEYHSVTDMLQGK